MYILPDDYADNFAASLLMLYFISSLFFHWLSWLLYICFKRFCLKRNQLFLLKTRFTIFVFTIVNSASKIVNQTYSELAIKFTLSIYFILCLTFLSFLSSFTIGTEKFMYFSVFSSTHLNCPSFKIFSYKMIVIIRTIMEHHSNLFWYYLS